MTWPAAPGGSAVDRRVVRIAVAPLTLPLVEPFAIAQGAQHEAANVLVEIELADGTLGRGECAPFPAVSGETQATTMSALREGAGALRGLAVTRVREAHARAVEAMPHAPAARSGLEQAWFDALARSLGLPLEDLWGGDRAPLVSDVTITASDVAHAVDAARRASERGFDVLKVKVGAGTWEADEARLSAIHAAVPGARYVLDANGGFAPDAALALARSLARRGIALDLFEQPVSHEDPDGLERVAREAGVPVCADESARSSADVVRLAARGAVHAVNVKITKTGVVEALDVVAIARSAGLALMIGGMVESELAMTFSARLARGTGAFRFVDLDTPMWLSRSPMRGGLRYEGGRVVLEERVGHGVDVDPAALGALVDLG